jgi:hypothetical protein
MQNQFQKRGNEIYNDEKLGYDAKVKKPNPPDNKTQKTTLEKEVGIFLLLSGKR